MNEEALAGWQRPDRGALFVVSGPTGVGKSTLISWATRRIPGMTFSVSATTRAPRPGEIDGVQYHFVDHPRFEALVGAGAFLEHARVYDQRYGTLREPVLAALAAGESVVLDIDALGAAQVRAHLPEAVAVMILPPSLDALVDRLRARGMTEGDIAGRLRQVAVQIERCSEYDYLVTNDDLATARETLSAIFVAELSRTSRRPGDVARARGLLADTRS